MSTDTVSKSWFLTFANPELHGFDSLSPQEICDKICSIWTDGFPTRSVASRYCISSSGLKHVHAVVEDSKAMRFSLIKKTFPSCDIRATKGTKDEAENYINKKGKYAEKGEIVVCGSNVGEIKGCQGQRRDFEVIEELINQGLTPHQIFNQSFSFRRYEKMIRDAYYDKRYSETPTVRNVAVYWHVGKSGTGKTYSCVKGLSERYGDGSVYLVSDYESGFDKYNGEPCIVLDEFRGQLRYATLLQLLDCYKNQIHCRFTNVYALWSEVHIATVKPPERLYRDTVDKDFDLDTYEQLSRRIDFVVYHYKENEEFKTFELPMSEYIDYDALKSLATSDPNGFSPVPDESVPDSFVQADVSDFVDTSNYSGIDFI